MAGPKTAKPKKPYQEFPMFPHASGQWAKKIKGKLWYFGIWEDPDAAFAKYSEWIHEIHAGRDPRRTGVAKQVYPDSLTIADLCNLFMERQESRVQAGTVSTRHFSDCLKSCELIVNHFGKFMRAAALRAADFQNFRAAFPETWGAIKTANEIQRIRSVFKWGFDSELIPHMPNFGPDFKKPSRTAKRRDQQQRQADRGGKLDFTSAEMQKLLGAASGWLKACILLGINGGLGNADCGRLSTKFLDLDSGWYDLPRQKTGIQRRFKLWPETIEAIRAAMRQRPIAKNDEDDSLCFLTTHGKPVWWEATKETGEVYMCDNIAKAFKKLCEACGITRSGRGFYSLRRTFETVAGATKDQVAVDYIMGHVDESMAAVYRQGVEDQRLIDVTNYVHAWLYPPKPAREAEEAAEAKPAKRKPAKRKAATTAAGR